VQIVLPGGQEIIRQINNLVAGQTLNVADGAQQTVTFTSPGTHQISVFVDFTNTVQESNEANNIAQLVINVQESPGQTQ
jgi:subtilase family serine protease